MNDAPSPDAGANLPRFQQIQLDFAAYIRNPRRHPVPEGIDPERMKVYADLFYNNVEGFLRRTFSVTHSIFDKQAWHAMARDFFDRHRSASPYFLEIPEEFLHYLREERDQPDDPPWLLELCHYEWVELALDVADVDPDLTRVDRDGDLLDGVPVVSPLVQTLGYQWPVHEIGPKHVPEVPPAQPTWLVVYRDLAEKVRFQVAPVMTIRLLDLLREGEGICGRDALRKIAGEMSMPDPDALLEAGGETLRDLRERDVILGVQS